MAVTRDGMLGGGGCARDWVARQDGVMNQFVYVVYAQRDKVRRSWALICEEHTKAPATTGAF